MSNSPASLEQGSRFLLRGEIENAEVRFPLISGETRIGSSSDSDLRLAVPGVSRQHALVTVSNRGVVVEDRGSRNGTRINGHRIRRGALEDGATLEIGPVALQLENLHALDTEIAIRLDSSGEPGSRTLSEVTIAPGTQLSTLPLEAPGRRRAFDLELLEGALQRIAEDGADRSGFLAFVSERTGARGVASVGWEDGTPVARAAVGEIGELPPLAALRELDDEPSAACWIVSCDRPSPATLVLRRKSGQGQQAPEALVLWHAARLAESVVQALRCLGLIDGLSARNAPPAVARHTRHSKLAFPPEYVPATSPRMLALYDQIKALTENDLSVILTGESGVGKETVAEILYRSSNRSRRPFVAVNCAAIPAELLESEMFGVQPGAATGTSARPGRFREADGGVLFLDEVGELPPSLQPKLLRALQEGEVTPLGGRPERVDVRVISATNVDLQQAIEKGSFRSDLYYRLAGATLLVPALRQRRQDIAPLVEHFLNRFSRERGVPLNGLTLRALELLTEYPWPGNVRQLCNELQRLAYTAPQGGVIDSTALSEAILVPTPSPDAERLTADDRLELAPRLEALERTLVTEALRRTAGVQIEAARLLGVSRNGLAKKLRRLRIDPMDVVRRG